MDVDALRATIKDKESLRFVDAWQRWRDGRLIPGRDAMELADVAPNLDTLALFDVVGPDHIQFRVFGSRLRMHEVIEIEPTGRNYKELTAPEDWPQRSQRFMAMSRRPCGGYMTLRIPGGNGSEVTLECVNLPIGASDPTAPYQVICCTTPLQQNRDIAQPPRLRSFPAMSGFTYVDIGAGVPDPD